MGGKKDGVIEKKEQLQKEQMKSFKQYFFEAINRPKVIMIGSYSSQVNQLILN